MSALIRGVKAPAAAKTEPVKEEPEAGKPAAKTEPAPKAAEKETAVKQQPHTAAKKK